jgi:predicted Zn-dependent protease
VSNASSLRSTTKSRLVASLFFTLFIIPSLAASMAAQQDCPVPPAIQPVPHEQNIFSDQQEVDLGDVMAESLARRIKIIDDDKLNGYLRTLGGRLVQHLPPNQLKFRFYLVELSEVNAFSIAGGRVYVARKMVALTRSDDELAGLVTEQVSGELALHALEKISADAEALAIAKLPQARLGPLRAAAVTADFNWMAISHGTRGAVWDVTHNIRTDGIAEFSWGVVCSRSIGLRRLSQIYGE